MLSNHRLIGQEQKLFVFNDLAVGSCFFLPKGTIIYNNLISLLRKEYKKRNYHEVITPNLFDTKLFEQSGHLENYKNNMFILEQDNLALKPMNCPSHCLMYKTLVSSYKDLPLRLADFGVLHRNEASGSISGLTRVRKFSQDDAHIFCRKSQIKQELKSCFDFLDYIYSLFNFNYRIELSTRPKNFIGDITIWNEVEQILEETLKENKIDYTLNKEDGAFYAPKIDIHLTDSQKRSHQCGTIQLDFNLPNKFNLTYQNEKGELEIPIIIHRAIFGSIERFYALLLEHYNGDLPFWLSPNQIKIISINDKVKDYCDELYNIFNDVFNVDIDTSNDTIDKKIRNAEINKYCFIFVVGTREVSNTKINIRYNNVKLGEYNVQDVYDKLIMMNKLKSNKFD